MATPPVPELLRAHLKKLAESDERLDGRARFEGREVIVETGVLSNAEGSARVQMGDTIVLAGNVGIEMASGVEVAFTPGRLILAVPSKLTPPIVLAF